MPLHLPIRFDIFATFAILRLSSLSKEKLLLLRSWVQLPQIHLFYYEETTVSKEAGNDMLSCQTLILSLTFLRKCALPTGFFRISNDFTPSSTVTSSSVASKADKKITFNSLFIVLSR